MIRKHVFLPEDHVAKLRELAKASGFTMADLIRLAIKNFLGEYDIRKTKLPPDARKGS